MRPRGGLGNGQGAQSLALSEHERNPDLCPLRRNGGRTPAGLAALGNHPGAQPPARLSHCRAPPRAVLPAPLSHRGTGRDDARRRGTDPVARKCCRGAGRDRAWLSVQCRCPRPGGDADAARCGGAGAGAARGDGDPRRVPGYRPGAGAADGRGGSTPRQP